MPLSEPPAPAALTKLRSHTLAGAALHRIFHSQRRSPWWFASLEPGTAPEAGGRFDLRPPDGACYTARSVAGAVLEAFQEHSRGLLPASELRARKRAVITCPDSAPNVGQLTAAKARSLGVTAALWAGADRRLTQAWATALRRAGWLAIGHGVQQDPTGRLRAVTLFDAAGEHAPYDDSAWVWRIAEVADDGEVAATLARHGFTVVRSDPQLPVIPIDDHLGPPPP